MNNSKNKIRQYIRAKRNALSLAQQNNAANQVYEHVVHLPHYRLSQHIAFYLSTNNELNPERILLEAHHSGKKCYLPVLHSQKIGTLYFLPYAPGDELVANRFGILEPVTDNVENHMPSWQLDLVFVPLVAFDERLNRLGMGKGYYDRTFEFLKHASTHKPYLVGLAFHLQQVSSLSFEAHDIPLNAIVTEKVILSS
jgi:5-formyltetrahydrofolate cyclo-ligase